MNEILNMKKITDGCIESLDQMIDFIDSLDDATYQQAPKPLFDSSIGQHLRHILDLYIALIKHHRIGAINYDVRRRGIELEHVRITGIAELRQVKNWVSSLATDQLTQDVIISTEVSISSIQTSQCRSSFARELCFASSHLTHHLALMAAIAKYLGLQVDAGLGIAPSTATFIRTQQEALCVQ